jgi:hypothetical protein
MTRLLWAAALLLPLPLVAQGRPARDTTPRDTIPRDTTPPASVFGVTEYQLARQKLEQDMQRDGFTVYIIADMEGLAGAVRNQTEMRPVSRGGSPQHQRFREELTDEVNALIAGARAAGATQFVVNEGHGGTLFRNPDTGVSQAHRDVDRHESHGGRHDDRGCARKRRQPGSHLPQFRVRLVHGKREAAQ